MSRATSRSTRWAVAGAVALLGLALAGYLVEQRAAAESASDEVGFGVPWSHELHARHPGFDCRSCHHDAEKRDSSMRACDEAGCHSRGPAEVSPRGGDPNAPLARRALHASCAGCHKAMDRGPTDCRGCHAESRGSARCGSCHTETYAAYTKAGHAGLPCAPCHGTLEDNLRDGSHPRPVPSLSSAASCLGCHGEPEDAAGFPAKRFERTGVHAGLPEAEQARCVECHSPHEPAAR